MTDDRGTTWASRLQKSSRDTGGGNLVPVDGSGNSSRTISPISTLPRSTGATVTACDLRISGTVEESQAGSSHSVTHGRRLDPYVPGQRRWLHGYAFGSHAGLPNRGRPNRYMSGAGSGRRGGD